MCLCVTQPTLKRAGELSISWLGARFPGFKSRRVIPSELFLTSPLVMLLHIALRATTRTALHIGTPLWARRCFPQICHSGDFSRAGDVVLLCGSPQWVLLGMLSPAGSGNAVCVVARPSGLKRMLATLRAKAHGQRLASSHPGTHPDGILFARSGHTLR